MKFKKTIVIILIFALALGIAGCTKEVENPTEEPTPIEDNSDTDSDVSPIDEGAIEDEEPDDKSDQGEIVGIHPGETAPEFSLEDNSGELIKLDSFRGKPLVFSFWVSWNDISNKQLEILNNVELLLGDEVAFAAIHATTFDTITQTDAVEIVNGLKYNIKYLFDKEADVQKGFYVGSFPTTYIIDHQGKIYKAYTSLVEEDKILEDLEAILEELLP